MVPPVMGSYWFGGPALCICRTLIVGVGVANELTNIWGIRRDTGCVWCRSYEVLSECCVAIGSCRGDW